jgi:hypothetical protein
MDCTHKWAWPSLSFRRNHTSNTVLIPARGGREEGFTRRYRKTSPGYYGERVSRSKEVILEYQTIKGEKVPSLGLGTWRLSGEVCIRVVECALALGCGHIDTAQM